MFVFIEMRGAIPADFVINKSNATPFVIRKLFEDCPPKEPAEMVYSPTLAIKLLLAEMLLEVRLVMLPMGLVIEVAALIVLALTNPLADMLLLAVMLVEVRLVMLPLGLVIEVAALTVLALT